ncbi:MAG: hypothetical protein ABW189_00455 [Rickettsiales bacterium]
MGPFSLPTPPPSSDGSLHGTPNYFGYTDVAPPPPEIDIPNTPPPPPPFAGRIDYYDVQTINGGLVCFTLRCVPDFDMYCLFDKKYQEYLRWFCHLQKKASDLNNELLYILDTLGQLEKNQDFATFANHAVIKEKLEEHITSLRDQIYSTKEELYRYLVYLKKKWIQLYPKKTYEASYEEVVYLCEKMLSQMLRDCSLFVSLPISQYATDPQPVFYYKVYIAMSDLFFVEMNDVGRKRLVCSNFTSLTKALRKTLEERNRSRRAPV